MTDYERYKDFRRFVESKIPGFKVRFKDSNDYTDPWRWKVIRFFARFVMPTFFTNFGTTLYPYVYVPRKWENDYKVLYEVMRHEYIHLRDEQRFGLLYQLSYVLFLPCIFTMRAYWERRGYAQTLIEIAERRTIKRSDVDWVVEQFTDANYAWMDPWAEKKIQKIVNRINTGTISGLWPYPDRDYPRRTQ